MKLTSSFILFITYEEENIRENSLQIKEQWANLAQLASHNSLFKTPYLKFPGWMFITMKIHENARNSFEVEKLFHNLK